MNIKRKKIIKKLRNNRYTYERIGNILGISSQRVHQIITGYQSPANKRKTQSFRIKPIYITEKINNKGLSSNGFAGRDYLREIVRRRDNHVCQICGKKWYRGQRRLDVHHLNKNKEGKCGMSYKENIHFEKMITLCHKCHMNLDSVRKKLTKKKNKKLYTP